jgi:acid-sensing ion channel, other
LEYALPTTGKMDPKSINFGKRALNLSAKNKAIKSFKLMGTSLKVQVTEFFNNSTLHGVRYIAEPGRPFGEK